MTDHDWQQLEKVLKDGFTTRLKHHPDLQAAIEKLRGKPIGWYTTEWLMGFCEGAVAARRHTRNAKT
jgi:hypothetical protein